MSKQAVVIKMNNGDIVAVVAIAKEKLSTEAIERFNRMSDYLDLEWSSHDLDEANDLKEISKKLYENHGLDPEDYEPTAVTGRMSANTGLANFPKPAWEPCDPSCKGWIHMDEPVEIERCDECNRFKTDDEAIAAHRKECGCGYPEMDYHAWLSRRIGYCTRGDKVSGKDAQACMPIDELLSERNIIPNLPKLFEAVTEALNAVDNPAVKKDLGYCMDVLKEIRRKVESGELTEKHFAERWPQEQTA